ncbi:hypothetical protein AX774_g6641 [Zancudomyces culisetae]|uniref:Uncharacterized protein n=1 Tax=Zancudomyces culisetae TaxID=1213189 RepID=A0A1R1PG58_ZANCU|nr:hypothetical protein AX774_g6641 [Zancudomyces culisetae]|eukprot:OMH79927.1 hypothetical protein AX774_g6641 [Zancudomyces culisetae]
MINFLSSCPTTLENSKSSGDIFKCFSDRSDRDLALSRYPLPSSYMWYSSSSHLEPSKMVHWRHCGVLLDSVYILFYLDG